jgi:hypothetical protein
MLDEVQKPSDSEHIQIILLSDIWAHSLTTTCLELLTYAWWYIIKSIYGNFTPNWNC